MGVKKRSAVKDLGDPRQRSAVTVKMTPGDELELRVRGGPPLPEDELSDSRESLVPGFPLPDLLSLRMMPARPLPSGAELRALALRAARSECARPLLHLSDPELRALCLRLGRLMVAHLRAAEEEAGRLARFRERRGKYAGRSWNPDPQADPRMGRPDEAERQAMALPTEPGLWRIEDLDPGTDARSADRVALGHWRRDRRASRTDEQVETHANWARAIRQLLREVLAPETYLRRRAGLEVMLGVPEARMASVLGLPKTATARKRPPGLGRKTGVFTHGSRPEREPEGILVGGSAIDAILDEVVGATAPPRGESWREGLAALGLDDGDECDHEDPDNSGLCIHCSAPWSEWWEGGGEMTD